MEGEQHFSHEKKEKPLFLYHASSNKSIEKFELRAESGRDQEEGPVIFATPDLALATTFLVNETDDSWTKIGKTNGVVCMVISDKKRFMSLDRGGSIYKFSSNSFTCDPHKGMGENEWVSKGSVAPIEKTDVESALEAMIENNVQVFFVDKGAFNQIKHSADWFDILKTLKSENKRRGKNVVEFADEK